MSPLQPFGPGSTGPEGHRCLFLSGIVIVLAAGCARVADVPVYPVQAQVLLNGDPLAEAGVVFHPLDQSQRSLSAYSNAQGEIRLTTRQPNDGAPAGDYEITVEFRELVSEGDELVRNGPNLLPARYSHTATANLRCTIRPGLNQLESWRLTSP